MPTGAAAEAELNETKNVLPMLSVRSVTYVAGCTTPDLVGGSRVGVEPRP
jgi:hypothetical protein